MRRTHGSILRALRGDPRVLERFWRHVRLTGESNDCWEWAGPVRRGAYPAFRIGGRSIAPSHVAWFTTVGELPEGGRIRLVCGNPRCVRPTHLAWALRPTMRNAVEALADGYVPLGGHAFEPPEHAPHDLRVLRAAVRPTAA